MRRFKKALKAAGVREIRFHDLRHTFGTRIAAAGVPMRVLQAWMGHRDYPTTLIYADFAPGPADDWQVFFDEVEAYDRADATLSGMPSLGDPRPADAVGKYGVAVRRLPDARSSVADQAPKAWPRGAESPRRCA